MPALHQLTLAKASEAVRSRKISPVELTRHCLERIQRLDPQVNAFITVTDDLAMAQARAAELEIMAGHYRGPLHGIPIALKDLIDVEGVRTTCASRVLEENVAQRDAEVTARLREAGAVILGKTNLHEFAYGGSGMISAYGPARNPWDTERITGGSSSGSAAAVASGMCFMAVGTDTAGSIRLPAAYCGLVGLKPTHGLVSTEGVFELSRSLDHVGPITRTVEDARICTEIMADLDGPRRDIHDIRFGMAIEFFFQDFAEPIRECLVEAMRRLSLEFPNQSNVTIPVSEDRNLQKAESYQVHQQWVTTTPQLYDPQTLQRVLTGADISTTQIEVLREQLAAFRKVSARVFEEVDVVVTPTVPLEPPRIADLDGTPELRPAELKMLRNTRPFDVLGWPTITIPCGLSSSGLPVGLQLSAGFRQERFLLDVAAECERILGFSARPRLFE